MAVTRGQVHDGRVERSARNAWPWEPGGRGPTQQSRPERVPFAAEVLLTDLSSGNEVWGETRNLSLGGCHVRTRQSFAQGTLLRIEIRGHSARFLTDARVAYAIDREGMGLCFLNIPANQRSVLEGWLLAAARELAGESSKKDSE
jgi:hypothetical protein